MIVTGGLVLDGDQHEVHLCEAEPGEKRRAGEAGQQGTGSQHTKDGCWAGRMLGGHLPLGGGRASPTETFSEHLDTGGEDPPWSNSQAGGQRGQP